MPTAFRSVLAHMRGQRVASTLPGRYYLVNRETGLLYPLDGDAVASEPITLDEDAAEFRQFPKAFAEVGYSNGPSLAPGRPRKAPPPPPVSPQPRAPKPAPGPSQGEDNGAPPALGDPGLLDRLPPVEEGHNVLTTREWLDLSDSLELGLTDEERATKPKQALVYLIRSRAYEKAGVPVPD